MPPRTVTESGKFRALRGARVAPAETARRLRTVLASPEFRSENHRKAALRRIVHEAVAGLDADGAALYVDELRTRFPDRVYEATMRLQAADARLQELEQETTRLRAELERLTDRMSAAETLVTAILESAMAAAGAGRSKPPTGATAKGAAGGTGAGAAGGGAAAEAAHHRMGQLLDADALRRLAQAMERVMASVAAQEAALAGIDDTFGRGGAAAAGPALGEQLRRLVRAEARPETILAELERRLQRVQMLPAALLAGAQQSWKGGTQGLLEELDPKRAEEEVSSRVPGIREAAVLKETRRRHEQFWDDLDKNIEHFYREVFRKVYSEKMEGRS